MSEEKNITEKKIIQKDDRVHTWPYLARLEFLCVLIFTIGLLVWSITINAPLEEAANPTKTPNPSKAPWYFLGLQEMLVYFDPWIAGVVLPTFIIIGLIAIPYIDINPKGNGYYNYKDRKFAINTFMFGFLVLWVALIILGVFFRGPGWNLFWPWQEWDPHKVVALTNVDLSYQIGIRDYNIAFIFGAVVVLGYFILGHILYFYWNRAGLKNVGYLIMGTKAFLFLTMMSLPIKMILRLVFNTKYVWVTPWFNI